LTPVESAAKWRDFAQPLTGEMTVNYRLIRENVE